MTDAFDFDARKVGTLKTVAWDTIGPKDIGVDIGEATRAKFAAIVKGAKTVVWNGPMGVFEIADDRQGHARGRPGAGRRHVARRDHGRRRRRLGRGDREERPRER